MDIKKVSILLPLFIFGITTEVWADSVKSINSASNQVITMKMDENNVPIQKKMGAVKDPIKTLEKSKSKFQSLISYSDYGAMEGNTKLDINFLKNLEEKKRSLFNLSLDKLFFSYKFTQNAWRDRFLTLQNVGETKSSNSELGQSVLKPYADENKYSEEGRILATLKLLQSKREEIFKEIFMGFRLSFRPLGGHMFLEMNVNPSSEKGPGFIITF